MIHGNTLIWCSDEEKKKGKKERNTLFTIDKGFNSLQVPVQEYKKNRKKSHENRIYNIGFGGWIWKYVNT
jgi:hypothetical protein